MYTKGIVIFITYMQPSCDGCEALNMLWITYLHLVSYCHTLKILLASDLLLFLCRVKCFMSLYCLQAICRALDADLYGRRAKRLLHS